MDKPCITIPNTEQPNDTLRTIHGAHSTHGGFSDRPVTREDIERVIEAAMRAPNASNRQSYSIVVTEGKEGVGDLYGYKGTAALLFCVDYSRLRALAETVGCSFEPNGPIAFVTGLTDACLAAQTASLACTSLGISTLFTNSIHRTDIRALSDRLNLPEEYCFPVIALVMGYADEAAETTRKGRYCGPGLVHWGGYHGLTPLEAETAVAAYDQPDAGMGDGWRKDFEHYLQWFFTVWSGPPNPEAMSGFQGILAERGFLLR